MIELDSKVKCDFCEIYIKGDHIEVEDITVREFLKKGNQGAVNRDSIHICIRCYSKTVFELVDFVKDKGYNIREHVSEEK